MGVLRFAYRGLSFQIRFPTVFERILTDGALLFAGAFLLHVLLWRLLRPSQQIRWLGLVFMGAGPALGAAALSRLGRPPEAIAYTLVLAALLAAAYILSYPAMQAQAPSLEMVKRIARGGTAGLSYAELRDHFAKQDLIGCRQQDLLTEGLIRARPDGGHDISFTARAVLHTMHALRRWLGLREGEG